MNCNPNSSLPEGRGLSIPLWVNLFFSPWASWWFQYSIKPKLMIQFFGPRTDRYHKWSEMGPTPINGIMNWYPLWNQHSPWKSGKGDSFRKPPFLGVMLVWRSVSGFFPPLFWNGVMGPALTAEWPGGNPLCPQPPRMPTRHSAVPKRHSAPRPLWGGTNIRFPGVHVIKVNAKVRN